MKYMSKEEDVSSFMLGMDEYKERLEKLYNALL